MRKSLSLKCKNFVLIAIILNIFVVNVWSQENEDLDGLVNETKNDLLVVVGGGLAGAILGLSTLSFVEEPKAHTRNIVVGASIGVIAGVGYVAFSQATKTQDLLYGEGMEGEAASTRFNTMERSNWHASNSKTDPIISPYSVGVSFRY